MSDKWTIDQQKWGAVLFYQKYLGPAQIKGVAGGGEHVKFSLLHLWGRKQKMEDGLDAQKNHLLPNVFTVRTGIN